MLNSTVINFIEKFNKKANAAVIFNDELAYWFAQILYTRFKHEAGVEIVYNPTVNHFGCRINGTVYDISGKISDEGEWWEWSIYCYADPAEAKRIADKYSVVLP